MTGSQNEKVYARAFAGARALVQDENMRHLLGQALGYEDRELASPKPDWWQGPWPPPPAWHPETLGATRAILNRWIQAGVAYYNEQASTSKKKLYSLTDREAVRLVLEEAGKPRIPVAPEEVVAREGFEAIASSGDAVAALLPHVAPGIEGLEEAKRAVLLSMASLDDQHGERFRIHALLVGPPGVAKSRMLYFADQVTGCGVYGPRTTGVGLTANLTTGQPGLMPRLAGTEFGLLAVDEVEKIDRDESEHMLQGLEEGKIPLAGGGLGEQHFDAAVRFVGAANEGERLPEAFQDRMDFWVEVRRQPLERIVGRMAKNFRGEGGVDPSEEDAAFVRDYLRWVRPHPVVIPEGIEELVREIVVGNTTRPFKGGRVSENASPRFVGSIFRIAAACARLNRGDVTEVRVREAARYLGLEA